MQDPTCPLCGSHKSKYKYNEGWKPGFTGKLYRGGLVCMNCHCSYIFKFPSSVLHYWCNYGWCAAFILIALIFKSAPIALGSFAILGILNYALIQRYGKYEQIKET